MFKHQKSSAADATHGGPGLRARAEELWAALQTWPWTATLHTLRLRFIEDRLGLTASSLAFTTLMAIVPLFTVMLALFTAFPIFWRFRMALENYLIKSLVPDTIAKPVITALTQFAGKAGKLGSLGLLGLLVTSVMLLLTIDRTLNAIWRVRQRRSLTQRVMVYWAALTLGPLVLGVSLTASSYALSVSKGWVGGASEGVALLLDVLQFVLVAWAMAAMFRYVPNTHVRWAHAWAGGWFVAAGMEVTKKLLAVYFSRVPVYATIYGAFASLPIFFIWLYLAWVVVLLGAVIAAYAPSLQMRVVRRPHTPGYQFELALVILRVLRTARSGSQHGMSLGQLARRLRVDPLQIEPLLDLLVRLDWVGRLAEAGDARYVLMCDAERTSVEPLAAQLLLKPSADVAAVWRHTGLHQLKLSEVLEPGAG